MHLKVWMLKQRLNCIELADVVHRDPSIVHRWLTGDSTPNEASLEVIYRLTRGQVTPNDFYSWISPRARSRRKAAGEAG